jgi:DNA polymerase I-like protein with 3'-5' exonuclease and polymerase domains
LFPNGQELNLGLLLGEPSGGLLDVDLDCAEAIAAGAILLPNTAMSSGRKSRMHSHYWYRIANPPAKASTPFKDLNGSMLIELRSTGGQTVVWPSVHQSGERVGWHSLGDPTEVLLDELQRAVARTAAAALLAQHWPAKGGRQDAALALAGGLIRAGWQIPEVDAFVRAVATAARDDEVAKRCSGVQATATKLECHEPVTGWPSLVNGLRGNGEPVVRRVWEWLGIAERQDGKAATKTTPRLIEAYQPFPVEALPPIIRDHVVQGAATLGCDPAYLALPELTVAASAVGSTRTLVLKRGRKGWREPCILWTVIIGDSGTLKSPAWQTAVDPLFEEQRRLMEEYKRLSATYVEEMAAYKAAKKQTEKGEGMNPGEPPEQPIRRRVVCSDTTIEKLAEILEDNPRGVLVARDEFAGWLCSFQRYRGERAGSDLPNWLEMHRAGTIVVDRKTGDRRTLFVRPATVSITGSIQPGVLVRYLTPEFLESGLAARLLMAMPMPREKRWSETEIDPDTDLAYERLLRDLFVLDFGTDDQGRPIVHGLHLSPEAKTVWVAFYDAWAREQASAEGELAAAYSKLEAYAARFALLHHIVNRIAQGEDERVAVELESVQAGVTLARWFAREARRIYSLLSESQDERDTRRLVEFIRARGGRISIRKLQKSNSRKYPRTEDAEVALEALVQAGWGEWEPSADAKGPGRPASRVFRLREEEPPPDDGDPEGPDDGSPDAPPDLLPTADNTDKNPQRSDTGSPGVSDNNTDNNPGTPPIFRESVIFVGNVGRGAQVHSASEPDSAVATAKEVLSDAEDFCQTDGSEANHTDWLAPVTAATSDNTDSNPTVGFQFVRELAELATVCQAVDESQRVALDIETTGLDARSDRLRLLALHTERGTYLVDCFRVNPEPLWPLLCDPEKIILGANLMFDLPFLWHQGDFEPAGPLVDVVLLSRLLTAGGRDWHANSLADIARRELGLSLNKSFQVGSSWCGDLTEAHLRYAAEDVRHLPTLAERLQHQIVAAGLNQVAQIEMAALPAWVWLARSGVLIDRDAWHRQAEDADRRLAEATAELERLAPQRRGGHDEAKGWNWDSPKQVKAALELLGFNTKRTDDEALAALDHPFAQAVRKRRAAKHYVGHYGHKALRWIASDGRIYASWNPLGNEAGRSSCKEPNLQGINKDGALRRCFVAPSGRVLIKSDFSQAHLRIVARMAQEKVMAEAYSRVEDLHVLMAQKITGKAEVTRDERQLAKAVNFGLLYAMSPRGLLAYAKASYGVDMTLAQAQQARRAFFELYPGIRRWHERTERAAAAETRSLCGRRRLCHEKMWLGDRLSSPVLGTEADALKIALGLLWERRQQCPGAYPVLVVHDEVVVEAPSEEVERASGWLKQAMVDAMTPLVDPVSVEVELKAARSWGSD